MASYDSSFNNLSYSNLDKIKAKTEKEILKEHWSATVKTSEELLDESRQMFYKVLTTELMNQLPDDTQSSSDISGHMIQIQQAEQTLLMRDSSDKMLDEIRNMSTQQKIASALGHIGKSVFHKGNELNLDTLSVKEKIYRNGKTQEVDQIVKKAVGAYVIPKQTDKEGNRLTGAIATIYDEYGATIFSSKVPTNTGKHYIAWDGVKYGLNDKIDIAENGKYNFIVKLHYDGAEKSSFAETYTIGEVQAVKHDRDNSDTVREILEIGSKEVELDEVLEVTDSGSLLMDRSNNPSTTHFVINSDGLSKRAIDEIAQRAIYNESLVDRAFKTKPAKVESQLDVENLISSLGQELLAEQ